MPPSVKLDANWLSCQKKNPYDQTITNCVFPLINQAIIPINPDKNIWESNNTFKIIKEQHFNVMIDTSITSLSVVIVH